jgi:hypothetical protein
MIYPIECAQKIDEAENVPQRKGLSAALSPEADQERDEGDPCKVIEVKYREGQHYQYA